MTDDVELLTQKVIGYRQFSLDYECRKLCPTFVSGYPWEPGVNHAVCRQDVIRSGILGGIKDERQIQPEQHTAPKTDCQCGFYAYHHQMFAAGGRTAAAIAAWGDVDTHYAGFRAEYAEILALAADDQRERDRLRLIAKRYDVPIIPYADLVSYASEHGSPMPESLRPDASFPGTYFGGLAAPVASIQVAFGGSEEPLNLTAEQAVNMGLITTQPNGMYQVNPSGYMTRQQFVAALESEKAAPENEESESDEPDEKSKKQRSRLLQEKAKWTARNAKKRTP